ncbi:TPA: hypothetical protein EYN65_13690 [Candidatus Poribacteria bacterium]|jgi:2-keto-4-pentenoate hydratase|nr:hypothetical protein [Candidatus Poribacteria bacterium]HIC03609.1 hypothetical protein [Candidatus Poribacteria bacterium]HIO48078.1 hypothetical protein [Candidatus Poribacteria bacterium]HIO81925.1 hypothetical protein [Candidatus Poribacteria bacterium]
MNLINLLAKKFFEAFYEKEWVSEFSPHISNLDISEAYQVQDLVAKMRIENGEEEVGFKVGCTSHAIHSQFGLQEPIIGRLFAPHIHVEGEQLNWKDYVNCAIEPEMVLKIGMDLRGESLSDDQLINAIEYVSPGIEIHNFKFWYSPPSSQELICSGGIHAGLVIGNKKVSPKKLSFQNEVFRVYKDGVLVTKAPASEIMGGPLHSLRWLIKFLTQRGMCLKKDSFVIPGSPVELVTISTSIDLKVEIDLLGNLVVKFKN